MKIICKSGLSNYYGDVDLALDEAINEFYLVLEDWDDLKAIKVSSIFANNFSKEFKNTKEQSITVDFIEG